MNHPLVSVCIPTYNAAEFFEPCLQSALAQTYPNLEILISDDGSTDDTLAVAEKYRQRDGRIRIVKNKAEGMVNNWNNCVEQARGEWVKLLFQDDLLKPACVEKMVNGCLQHKVDVGLCRRDFIIHPDVPKITRFSFRYKIVRPERIFDDLAYISPERLAAGAAEHLGQNVLGEPTCYLFHKRIFSQTGLFNPEFRQIVDYEFILRLGLKNGLAFSAKTLATFRVHNASESSANTKEGKAVCTRNVAAVTGDIILLFYHFLHDPEFALMKKAAGEKLLDLHIKHLYHSGCKHKGKTVFNKALQPLRKKYKELGSLEYSFFKYVYYRKLFKNWERHDRISDERYE